MQFADVASNVITKPGQPNTILEEIAMRPNIPWTNENHPMRKT